MQVPWVNVRAMCVDIAISCPFQLVFSLCHKAHTRARTCMHARESTVYGLVIPSRPNRPHDIMQSYQLVFMFCAGTCMYVYCCQIGCVRVRIYRLSNFEWNVRGVSDREGQRDQPGFRQKETQSVRGA
jgi:hypothetical protein